MADERRFEVIIREHTIERDGSKVKSRRYDIYKRVFDIARREQVVQSVEAALNEQTPF